jgi:hypothetical protein
MNGLGVYHAALGDRKVKKQTFIRFQLKKASELSVAAWW